MNTAYPLYPVAVITLLLYFTTLIFARWDIFPLKLHRKFWNYLLLVSFLVSGLIGILSVIKVNYKLEIPKYETYLQWHVSFGISLVFIAFFHLSWHLKYYFRFSRKSAQREAVQPGIPSAGEPGMVRRLLFLLGFTTIISQVVFIREFISVLSGNELVLGLVIASWMLLTGWGAFRGKGGISSGFTAGKALSMLLVLSLFPLLLITLLYLLKSLMFPPGTQVNFLVTLFASIVLLFPACFLSGYLFTGLSTLYSETASSNKTGKSYSIESLGSLAGGVLFSIILGRYLNSFEVIGLTSMTVFLTGSWTLRKSGRARAFLMLGAGVLVPSLIVVFNPDTRIKKLFYPNQEILVNRGSRYGNLVITGQAGQINVYENNALQFYTDNIILNEEAVHFAMIQHPDPKKVLLVSGGISGMIREIKKYDVDEITYLESNPEIFRLLEKYVEPVEGKEQVRIIKKDIRNFVGRKGEKYDAILMNLPPPTSLGNNRFYTEEFFFLLKKHCTPETVICTSLPSTANYAGEHALEANSSLWKTLGTMFDHVVIVSGEKNYFIASDEPIDNAFTEKIAQKNIETEYVNSFYLDDRLLSMRSEALLFQFNENTPVNRDFYPFLFVKEINHWLSYFGTRYRLLVVVPLLLFLLFFTRTNRITAGLYTGGFTAASLEVTLLLAYQVYFGSIYLATATFFAVFMAGLAFGSAFTLRISKSEIKSYYILQYLLALFALVLPLLIRAGGQMPGGEVLSRFMYLAILFLLSSGIGYEFLLASRLRNKSYSDTSGVNYGTDLAGSAFGAYLAAVVLLPLFGLIYTCLIVAALNLVSGTLAFSARKSCPQAS